MAYIGNQPTTVAFLTDQFSGTGSQTAFTLSAAPANTASILVAVSGVLQDPSTYSVSGTTLTFSAAPPSGTGNISVRFLGIPASGVVTTAYRTVTEFTATASQTTFTPPSYTAGFINVYRNGVMLGAADYTATNGTTVVLATGATSGDLITTESFSVSSVLNAIPATAGAVNSTYIQDGGVTRSKMGYAGAVLQVIQTTKTDTFSTTSGSLTDITGMSVSITPSSSTSNVLITFTLGQVAVNSSASVGIALLRGSTVIGAGATAGNRILTSSGGLLTTDRGTSQTFTFVDTPATTSATTYKLQIYVNGGNTVYVNRSATDTDSTTYTRTASTIIAMEIAA